MNSSMDFSHFLLVLLLATVSMPLLAAFLLRNRIWCNCRVCTAYRTSSWAREFPNLSDWYTHLLQTSPTQTIHIHILGNTITANPAVVEHILRARFENYPKGKKFSRILGDLLGTGIFNVDGSSWAFQRKHASAELGSVSIRTFAFETVKGVIEQRLLPLLSSFASRKREFPEPEVSLDLQEVFKRFSFDNVCTFSFGFDPGCLDLSLPISHFADAFDLATKLSAERALAVSPIIWKIKRLLNVGSERRLREAAMVVKALAMDVIKNKRKLGFLEHRDLLSRFMDCVSDEVYLRDIVISFVLAGRDTMASAMTAFFWLIRDRPEMVSRIRREADSVIGGGDSKAFPSFDQLKEMHYLQATVHESLRLYPPVQFDSKFALEDDELPDGTLVRRGTRVMYHPYAMGRMENIWGPDCMDFRPERWLDQNGKFVHQNPYKYPVFQAGVRVCLGKEMAIVEMKTVVLSVLREFDVLVVEPSSELRFDPGLTAFVKGGLKVMIKKRDGRPNNGDIWQH